MLVDIFWKLSVPRSVMNRLLVSAREATEDAGRFWIIWKKSIPVYFGRNFTTTAFRLALKFAQSHPLDTRMLDLLSFHQKSTVNSKYRLENKFEYRIIDGNMYHRLQSVCYPRTNSTVPFPHPCVSICRHLHFAAYNGKVFITFSNWLVVKEEPYGGDLVNGLRRIWESKWPVESGINGRKVGTGVRMCRHCNTYFDLAFIAESGNVSMRFKRWSMFGDGVDSKEWKRHFEPRGDVMMPTILGEETERLDAMFTGDILDIPELEKGLKRVRGPPLEERIPRCVVAG